MKNLPEVGSVWSFRTRPCTEFSPPDTGRYAAFKVVGRTEYVIVIGVLEGVWARPPALEEVACCGIIQTGFGKDENFEPACFGIFWHGWRRADLRGLACFGVMTLRADEAAHAQPYIEGRARLRYLPLSYANDVAELTWRMENDREAFLLENKPNRRKREAVPGTALDGLRGLNWDKLLSDKPFARWDESPPFPPAAFRDAARAKMHETCRALQALGPRPRRPDVRRLLKDFVEWFNVADAEAGEVIEIEEHGDIWEALYQMAWVARHMRVAEEFHEWRTW